ncbi:MAG: hypothetical protein QF724_02930 [Planctomycetota bacterium]|jgi:hypothetical protein|nr:hypothetical protein [Planctomycetota bacterium]MDP6519267.1 hypothetical protein [Planctomycetota bacterium]MDP6837864.1 hypothetical protein [Planctomycetota bacterium]MDP6955044.1 hypothetical protein [Planctomycetota bacterium]
MLTIVSDLLLTDTFLIRGNIENKYARLSRILDEHRRFFLKVRDATLIDLGTGDRITTPLLHVNMDEILLAHEFLDGGNDTVLADMAKDQELDRIRAFYTGRVNLEFAGHVRPGSYDVNDHSTRRFFVMSSPVMKGLVDHDDRDLKQLADLPYAILNKERVAFLYDFN